MLEFNFTFFAIAGPAVAFAGISKGGFGSGAAFASASILAVILPPGQALALMLPLLMLIDVASLRPYWGQWNVRASLLVILGGLPGVVLGALLFRMVDDDAMRVLIGAISLAFVVWQWMVRQHPTGHPPRRLGIVAGLLAGLGSGFASFVSHAGGPVAAVYLLSQRMAKTEYQASTVVIFWVINIAKFVPYTFLGMFTADMMWAGFFLIPFALIGTWMGVRLHHFLPESVFFGLTYVLLLVTGSKLIWDGLT